MTTLAGEPAMPERYRRLGPPPAEALARLMGMLETLGITRIADITGLDRVGIPVVQAVRPFSLSNAVSQGKGETLAEAAISAILESTESFFSERLAHFDTIVATAASLAVPPGRFDGHIRLGTADGWRDREIRWVEATDLLSGGLSMVPFELVHTAYVVPPDAREGLFESSTTGVAAAFAEHDAVLHGIMECIERDAIERANRTHGFLQRFRIDPKTIDHCAVCDLLSMLDAKGLLVGLWHAPSSLGVPVVWCHLVEKAGQEACLLPFPSDGSAAGLNPAAAVVHAILEAAQSRVAAISGARDDMTRALYPNHPDWRMIDAHRRLIADGPRTVDFDDLAGGLEPTGDPLPGLLARLASEDVDSVYRVRVDTAPVTDLSVVRILIPTLKPLLQG